MGHVHLCVAEIASTIAFYRDVLGFELMATSPTRRRSSRPAATTTTSARTSGRAGARRRRRPGTARLLQATVVLPDADARDRVVARVAGAGEEPEDRGEGVLVRDPSGNPIVLAVR